VLERQQKKRKQAELDDEEELREDRAPGGSLTSFFDEEKQMRDKARIAALHRQREREKATKTVIEDSMLTKVQAGFGRLAQLDDAVDAGSVEAVEEWLEIARELVEGFRQTKLLFPQDKVRTRAVLQSAPGPHLIPRFACPFSLRRTPATPASTARATDRASARGPTKRSADTWPSRTRPP
jgi:hypothetical protein